MEYVSRETCSGFTLIEYNVSRETFNQKTADFTLYLSTVFTKEITKPELEVRIYTILPN